MDKVLEFLNAKAFTLRGEAISYLDIIVVPCVLFLGFSLIRVASRFLMARMKTKKVNADAAQIIHRIFMIIAYVILAVTVLDLINVPLTAFAFVSGAIAIGVGFGAQNILNNFISGWILMWERPIKIGDFVEISGDQGEVESINTRSTRIRRTDGVHILVPNSQLLENAVVNWTLVDKLARTSVRVGVAYGSPTKKVAYYIMQAILENKNIIDYPVPTVIFEDFADSALVFDAYFWIEADSTRSLREVRSEIRFRINEMFAEQGIEIAYPQSDVHLDGAIKLIKESE